jgi:hypothetical protein
VIEVRVAWIVEVDVVAEHDVDSRQHGRGDRENRLPYGVLAGLRVKLIHGLSRTIEMPTSMPTPYDEHTCFMTRGCVEDAWKPNLKISSLPRGKDAGTERIF